MRPRTRLLCSGAAAIGLAAMDANDEQYRREAQTELAALGR